MVSQNLSQKLPWDLANSKWASAINPLLQNPLNSVRVLQDVSLIVGTNVINHMLGQTQQGWFFIDIQGALSSMPYRSAPFNSTTLTLYSPSNVVVSIGVF